MKRYFGVLIFALFLFKSCAQSSSVPMITIDGKTVEVFEDLEKALKNQKKVIALNLSNKGLNKFPAEVYLLKELKYLNLSSNQLTHIPDSIEVFNNLETLVLDNNNLVSVSSNMNKLKKLKNLVLSKNKLSSLPSDFYELKQLNRLILINNYFNNAQITRIRKLLPKTIVIAYPEEH